MPRLLPHLTLLTLVGALGLTGCQSRPDDVDSTLRRLQANVNVGQMARRDAADGAIVAQRLAAAKNGAPALTSEEISALRADNVTPENRAALRTYLRYVYDVSTDDIDDRRLRADVAALQTTLRRVGSRQDVETMIDTF